MSKKKSSKKADGDKIDRLKSYANKSKFDYRNPNDKIRDDLRSIPADAPEDLVRRLYRNVLLGGGDIWEIPASCKEQHFSMLLDACDEAINRGATIQPLFARFLFGRAADGGSLILTIKNKGAYARFMKCARGLYMLTSFWALPDKKSDWKSHRIFASDDELANAAAEALTQTGRSYNDVTFLAYWGMVFGLVRSATPKSMTCLRRLVKESVADPMREIDEDDYLGLLYRMLSLHDDAKVQPMCERVKRCLEKRNKELPAHEFAKTTLGLEVPLRWNVNIYVEDTRSRNTARLEVTGGEIRDWKIELNALTDKPRATYAAGEKPRITKLQLHWKPSSPGEFLEFLRRIAKELSITWDINNAFVYCNLPRKDRVVKEWLSTL